MIERIQTATSFLADRLPFRPSVGLILGSGLGSVVEAMDVDVAIPYSDIPGAAHSTVTGHPGRLVAGRLGETRVLVMQGRVHYYEGWSMEDVVLLPRVFARLGVRRAIVTNAAGGVNTEFRAGDLMLISDHINMFAEHPLRGRHHDELGPRFPDMTDAYSATLRDRARTVARDLDLELREGVYLGIAGPSYETPAEIRAWRTLGADAVGMSTVPEVLVFRQMDVEVLGISCITNMAAGILPQKLDHSEVIETTTRVQKEFTSLVVGVVEQIS